MFVPMQLTWHPEPASPPNTTSHTQQGQAAKGDNNDIFLNRLKGTIQTFSSFQNNEVQYLLCCHILVFCLFVFTPKVNSCSVIFKERKSDIFWSSLIHSFKTCRCEQCPKEDVLLFSFQAYKIYICRSQLPFFYSNDHDSKTLHI